MPWDYSNVDGRYHMFQVTPGPGDKHEIKKRETMKADEDEDKTRSDV